MKTMKVGDVFQGASFADMVNNVCGTHYKSHIPCWVSLQQIGGADYGIAWFVFMDGSSHGTHKDYLWQNLISPDGNTIIETFVGEDKREAELFLPHTHKTRLAFMRDPFGAGNNYQCKFVGLFSLARYDEKNYRRIYTKISDDYKLL